MLGTIHASNSFSTFLVATSVFVPVAPSPFVRTPGSVVIRALRPTRPFGLFVCSWVWFTRAAWKTRPCRLGGVPRQKIIREASNVALIGNIGCLNHLVPHRQDPEPQIPLEVEIFSPLVIGRPPNHEFSEHKSGKIVSLCDKIWIKKIRSRHPDRLLCLLLQKSLSVGLLDKVIASYNQSLTASVGIRSKRSQKLYASGILGCRV